MLNHFDNKTTHVYHDTTMLGHYLAGLWPLVHEVDEGDGYIHLKDKNTGKVTIHISMHRQQEVYVKKLLALLQRLCDGKLVGSVHIRHDNNSCVLNIFSPQGLMLVVDLMRNKLRTPKAYQLNRVIDWLNAQNYGNRNPIDFKALLDLNTPWFAGFTDADGSFGIDLRVTPRLKVACQFQMNQRMIDPKTQFGYKDIFGNIGKALGVNLLTVREKSSGRHYYVIKATSVKSKGILRHYFDRFPLLTSKFLDYQCWCSVDDLLRNKQHHKHLEQIQALKATMNHKRCHFTWDHLRKL